VGKLIHWGLRKKRRRGGNEKRENRSWVQNKGGVGEQGRGQLESAVPGGKKGLGANGGSMRKAMGGFKLQRRTRVPEGVFGGVGGGQEEPARKKHWGKAGLWSNLEEQQDTFYRRSDTN